MRLPRDISADDLIKALRRYGYRATRQTGSHVRLTRSTEDKEFHLTIPKHNPLRVGTLSNILKDLSAHLELERDKLIEALLEKI
jgi:predicted RNA binding protein YcfA (HicA-like mRNA interferase family)